jgi:N-acetylglucosamine-6-phosphate deacetylase
MNTAGDLFDLQVNGYAGIDFNADNLQPEQIVHACEQLEQHGVAGFLGTVITAEVETMCQRIRVLAQAIDVSPIVKRVMRGIHVEGPFINASPGFVGTHPTEAVLPAAVPTMQRLIDSGAGLVRLVTLAPEQDSGYATIRWLADQGIVASAGHCDPTLEQLRCAVDSGLSMFTHLGNGCPLLLNRHDNVIQRVLSLSSRIWICFIADGVHVPFTALSNYLKLAGTERAIVVSDSMSAAGIGAGRFSLASMEVVVDENLATWSSDGQHLMGSACPLHIAHRNLVMKLGVTDDDAWSLTCRNPRRAMSMH